MAPLLLHSLDQMPVDFYPLGVYLETWVLLSTPLLLLK